MQQLLAGPDRGGQDRNGRRDADVERVLRGPHRLRGSQKLVQALAVPFSSAWSGRKHTRTIALEPWQQEIVTIYPGSFVRGLFHSDGCRVINRVRRKLADGDRWYEYPRYFLSNESADIIGLCARTLDQLGVNWRMARPNFLSVARRESVARMDKLVGPKY